MTFFAASRRRLDGLRDGQDAGLALLTVIAMGFIMTSLMLGTLAYAAQVSPQARRDQDWNAALAAAQAGVDDYVSRLNKADSYSLSVDCANPAMKGPDAPANTCAWNVGASTPVGWQDVSPGNPGAGQFHYTPNYQAGSVRLVATGKVRNAYRTLDVRVARGGSTDFLYYTDFEDADPANRVAYSSASPNCGGDGPAKAKYWYETASSSNDNKQLNLYPTSTYDRRSCAEIQFAAGDKLDGKVHFNDTPLIGADTWSTHATFTQGFETSDPNCTPDRPQDKGYCYRITSSGTPNVGSKGMTFVARKELPDNSDQFANYPGCVYYGDTRIRFKSDGTMDVWNTSSKGKTIVGPNSGSLNCGDSNVMTTSGGDPRPGASVKQNVPVPTDMVIYVRNTGSSNTCAAGEVVNGTSSGSTSGDVIPQGSGTTEQGVTDINYWWPGKYAKTTTETFKAVQSGKWGGYSWEGQGQSSQETTSDSSHYTTFDCGQGNVYIEGTLKGRVTIAAENNVIVTGDLLLAGTNAGNDPTGTNIAGLVAGNSVVVYHPIQRQSPSYSNGKSTAQSDQSKVSCSGTVGNTPSTTAKSSSPVTTCTWTQTWDIGGGSFSNLSFPNATSSSGARWIYASIQTLQHSFWVQTYNRGNTLGDLSVRGSIAQRWRGAVGTGSGSGASTGYIKDYKYDARLKFSSPPYFPQWTNATWSAATTGELKPKYVGQ